MIENKIRIDLQSPSELHSRLEKFVLYKIEETSERIILNTLLNEILNEYFNLVNPKTFEFKPEEKRKKIENAKRFTLRIPANLFVKIKDHSLTLKTNLGFNVPVNSIILAIAADYIDSFKLVEAYI